MQIVIAFCLSRSTRNYRSHRSTCPQQIRWICSSLWLLLLSPLLPHPSSSYPLRHPSSPYYSRKYPTFLCLEQMRLMLLSWQAWCLPLHQLQPPYSLLQPLEFHPQLRVCPLPPLCHSPWMWRCHRYLQIRYVCLFSVLAWCVNMDFYVCHVGMAFLCHWICAYILLCSAAL
jgi:hypothetical protein